MENKDNSQEKSEESLDDIFKSISSGSDEDLSKPLDEMTVTQRLQRFSNERSDINQEMMNTIILMVSLLGIILLFFLIFLIFW